MSYKYIKACDRSTKTNSATTAKNFKRVTPKRVVLSRKLGDGSEKSCSTGIIMTGWNTSSKPRKTTKSDVSMSTKFTGRHSLDYCKKCGDAVSTNGSNGHSTRHMNSVNSFKEAQETSSKSQDNGSRKSRTKTRENGKASSVKQYYKNENFQSTESLHETENDFKKMSLDTIKEVPETDKFRSIDDNVFEIYSDSEEMGFLDTNDAENIATLKNFREDNYFECHSAKSRINSKGSATSLRDHKCVYRFYLNDRLFPVPLSSDHHNNVRCVECHLPMNLKEELDGSGKANGTIQAKVKINSENEVQDMILFLPVKDSLIIKERRKQIKNEEEVMYFGVIKLDTYGHSVFKSTLPTDSLALKYQKGYKEYDVNKSYKYKGIEQDDVIVI
ncbi:uncharacterized protein LOC114364230 [Ostrinia furnacalis]|uniref:uncharacterized protein LOC114364230 n=1 Tax=Ostrinia furnacalis TaxID=93504 RepID=UPI00103D7382|nr:uncharacterized protein LOC114364230 [Ostrinia furnacalis]